MEDNFDVIWKKLNESLNREVDNIVTAYIEHVKAQIGECDLKTLAKIEASRAIWCNIHLNDNGTISFGLVNTSEDDAETINFLGDYHGNDDFIINSTVEPYIIKVCEGLYKAGNEIVEVYRKDLGYIIKPNSIHLPVDAFDD